MTSLWECGWSCLCESKAICPALARITLTRGTASEGCAEGPGLFTAAGDPSPPDRRVLPPHARPDSSTPCTRKKTR